MRSHYHMTKFLRPKIWSHGTNLGSLGPRSQKGLDETFSKEVSLLPSNLNKHPGVVVPLVEPKNLNQVASRCDSEKIYWLKCTSIIEIIEFERPFISSMNKIHPSRKFTKVQKIESENAMSISFVLKYMLIYWRFWESVNIEKTKIASLSWKFSNRWWL